MRALFPLLFLASLLISSSALAESQQVLPVTGQEERLRRIFLQEELINAGNNCWREFKFDCARKKFLEATKPEYLNEAKNESAGLWTLSQMYLQIGEYDEVERIYQWHDLHGMGGKWIEDDKADLKARMIFQKTGNKKPVYAFIESYKKKHRNVIPPKWADAGVMATLAELYDLIGDYDAGIEWAKKFRKADNSEPLKRTRSEYDNLIRAFEESKRGLPKVCSDDGKYCVGRATAVIIRSKYF